MDTTNLQVKIESLESRLMHQEASIEELTRTLLEQERLLKLQAETIIRLEGQVTAIAGSTMTPTDEPPPPHY